MGCRHKLGGPTTLGPNITADGDSESINMRASEGARIIVTEVGGGTADIQPQGSAAVVEPGADDTLLNPYPMGIVKALGANETWTRWLSEPNSYLGVNVANVAGGADIKIEIQRFGE